MTNSERQARIKEIESDLSAVRNGWVGFDLEWIAELKRERAELAAANESH